MSASRSRRLVTAGSLSLALALAAPTAAFADDEEREKDKPSQSQQREDERDKDRKKSAEKQGDREEADRDERDDEGDRKTDGDRDRDAGKDGGKGAANKGGKGKSDEGRTDDRDPRGNNGTVKIDALPFDDTPGTESHVGCTFQIDFFGFDAGDTADITLTGQAPTGGGLLWSATDRLISNDAAGGGKDVDESITLSVSPDLAELLSIAPHPQQGWHVKLAVDVDSAPGGAKQKVFWIDCPQTAALGGTTESAATAGTTLGTRQLQGTTLGAGAGQVAAQSLTGTTLAAAERAQALTLGAGEAQAVVAAEEKTVAAGGGSRTPGTLPFTGTEGLAYLLALGLSALGVGTAAHRLGRRRAGSVV